MNKSIEKRVAASPKDMTTHAHIEQCIVSDYLPYHPFDDDVITLQDLKAVDVLERSAADLEREAFNLLAEAQDQRYRVDAIRRRYQALVEERDALDEVHLIKARARMAEAADYRAGDRVASLEEAEQQRRDLSSMEVY